MTKDQLQAEALAALDGKFRASAVLGTGSGKTLLALKHMMKIYTDYMMFAVVAPTAVIKGWKKEIADHKLDFLLDQIEFCTYRSLIKLDWKNTDYLYLDECHNLKESHAEWLGLYNGGILGLTGTYPKYKTSESYKVCNMYCPPAYTFKIGSAIQDGMLNNYKIYIHMLNLEKKPTVKTKYGVVSEENNYRMWSERVSKNPQDMMLKVMRMKAMQGYETKVKYAKMLAAIQTKKTLVFTDYTLQADKICEHTYHSKNKKSKENLEKFAEGSITKLASVQQLAEGINIPDLEVGIITHSYANEKKLPQKIGRFLRLNPTQTAIVHILCYDSTVDVQWVKAALKEFDKSKIFKYDIRKTIDSFQRL